MSAYVRLFCAWYFLKAYRLKGFLEKFSFEDFHNIHELCPKVAMN
jgi:hypothetical protein